MARRSGLEKFVMSMARQAARQQRINASQRLKTQREAERQERQHLRHQQNLERQLMLSKKEAEKVARAQYIEDREDEAEMQNREVAERLAELSQILPATLSIDDTISFDSLRIVQAPPPFVLQPAIATGAESPRREIYIVKVGEPTMFAKLIPGFSKRHANALANAEAKFQADYAEWQSQEASRLAKIEDARSAYAREVKALNAKIDQRNAEVDTFKATYFAADPDAVVAYNTMVLERSAYPEGFPQSFSLAFAAASKQLVVEYELPAPSIVPELSEFKYVKARDAIEAKPRKGADLKSIYQDVIASVALRTIHEIFEADQANAIETCCFNGYVHTVDPATGHDIQPHLISVRTTKEAFNAINLARVDKATCLRNLGAQVSRHASEAQPVKPIVEFNMADARFIDQSDLVSGLSSAPNLMDLTPSEFEHLVANLFGKMGLESKLTRSSRDGGVDCVAYDKRPVLGGKVVIQAKRYRHTVGVSAVRDLYGTMMNEGANKGILVTTSGYGPDAFNFASDKPIELIDGGGLLFLLQEIGMQARIIFPMDT